MEGGGQDPRKALEDAREAERMDKDYAKA